MTGKRKYNIVLIATIGTLTLGFVLTFKGYPPDSMYYACLMTIVGLFFGANAIGDHRALKRGNDAPQS